MTEREFLIKKERQKAAEVIVFLHDMFSMTPDEDHNDWVEEIRSHNPAVADAVKAEFEKNED